MSEYVNQMSIGVSDMVRLEFNEIVNNETYEVVCICMNFDFLKHIVATLEKVIIDHEKLLAAQSKMRETDKTLS